MENKNTTNSNIIITLTREELRIVTQALNEICNGIDISEAEFGTRIGAGRSEVQTLLSRLGIIYDNLDKAES